MTVPLQVVAYISIHSGQCNAMFLFSVIVSKRSLFRSMPRDMTENSSLFWSMSRDNSFFGRLVQNLEVLCFSESFVRKTTEQSDGSCIVTSDTQFLCKESLHFC